MEREKDGEGKKQSGGKGWVEEGGERRGRGKGGSSRGGMGGERSTDRKGVEEGRKRKETTTYL